MATGKRLEQAEAAVAKAQERLKQAKAAQRRHEARQRAALAKQDRRLDTRRKVLIGAVVLAQVQRGERSMAELLGLLDKELTRPFDREAFPELLSNTVPR